MQPSSPKAVPRKTFGVRGSRISQLVAPKLGDGGYFVVKTPKSLQFKPLSHFCLKSEDFTKILSNIY
jgi:hypothetical protein